MALALVMKSVRRPTRWMSSTPPASCTRCGCGFRPAAAKTLGAERTLKRRLNAAGARYFDTEKPRPGLIRGHPGAGFALCGRDLDIGHHLGDLAAHGDRIRASLQGGEIEPFVGGDQIDHAGTAARPVQAALEQLIGDRSLHRRCRLQIELSLKHRSPLFIVAALPRARPLSTVRNVPLSCSPFAGLSG